MAARWASHLTVLLAVGGSGTVLSIVALLALGHRWRWGSSALVRLAPVVPAAVLAGELAARLFALPSTPVLLAEGTLTIAAVTVALARRSWNPLGVCFFADAAVTAVAYLACAATATVAGGLRPGAAIASGGLLLLETAGLLLAGAAVFEMCDVVCRTRRDRQVTPPSRRYRPFVSIHVPACNEPPEMLIETIRSLEALHYPHFEIVVVDNNTDDPDLWKPVEEYCTGRPRVRYLHVAPWPGYKAGALNLALDEYTHPRAELVGIVDAHYVVDSAWLTDLVGYFADPAVAYVQTPQDHRGWEGDAYLTACHDAHAYAFAASMRSRNERGSATLAGTMGLVRRGVLDAIGGWDEWCLSEDAEASLRMLAAGYDGIYVHRSYGRGVMPLTFDALKRQRFRWCVGGLQILRKHRRSLVPWGGSGSDRLSAAQRLDFLVGGLQWFTDLVALGLTGVVAVATVAVLAGRPLTFRPLGGPLVVLSLALAVTGALRAVWALRVVNRLSPRRAVLAYANRLSLSLTVALGAARGLVRGDDVSLRTPAWRDDGRLADAVHASRAETALAGGLLAAAAVAVASGHLLLGALALWQACTYASAPAMAWLNLRSELPTHMRRRQRSEERGDPLASHEPRLVGAAVVVAVLGCIGFLALLLSYPGSPQRFEPPQRAAGDASPLGNVGLFPDDPLGDAPTTVAPPTTAATPPTSDPVPPTTAPPTATSAPSPATRPERTTTTNSPRGGPPSSRPGNGPPTSRDSASTV